MSTGVDLPTPVARVPGSPARRSRILYYYSNLHLHTGSPRALLSVIDGLDRDRFAPVFLACGEGLLVEELRARGVEIVPGDATPITPRRPKSAIAAVRAQVRLLSTNKIDLIHVHEYGYNYDLVIAAALLRIPIVLHVHNPVDMLWQNLHWLLANRIVFVSQAHRNSTPRLSWIKAKSTVIYNAVALDRFAQGRPVREGLGVGSNDFVVGTVSQVARRKGIDILVDAAAILIPKHPNLVFLIAGPGPPLGSQDFANKIRARADEPVFDRRLRFLGGRSDVPDLLASYDVFCLPTRAEPLGIAVIEAMAAGVPVLATRVGGIPEIITSPDIGTLVTKPTAASLAEAIEELMLHPERADEMGRAGAASLWGRFDGASIAVQWNALYSDVGRKRAAIGG